MRALYTLVIILAVCCCAAAVDPAELRPNIIVVKSVDAPGDVVPDRISECLTGLAKRLNVDVKALPYILVLHVSKGAAAAAGLKDNAIRHNNSNLGEDSDYYEMWIVGEPKVNDYVLAAENILEHHFKLKVSDVERSNIMKHVRAEMNATVDVQDLGR